MDDDSAKRGFKVEDRRRFSATGDARDDAPSETEKPAPTAEGSPKTEDSTEASAKAPPPREQAPLAEMSFSTFVIGLMTQALILLGEVPDPAGAQTPVDLAGAKQMIDILGILQAKTKGNLDAAEAGLLENALYDLRMKFVQHSRSK